MPTIEEDVARSHAKTRGESFDAAVDAEMKNGVPFWRAKQLVIARYVDSFTNDALGVVGDFIGPIFSRKGR